MLDAIEWLDSQHFPKFHFDHVNIDVVYQAASVDHGPGPIIVTFKLQCAIPHSGTGYLIYGVDDLSFMPEAFLTFAKELKMVLDGKLIEATLAPVGREFVLTASGSGKYVRLEIAIVEFQGASLPATTASAGCIIGNTDIAYRWVRDLHDYADRLEDWVVANSPL